MAAVDDKILCLHGKPAGTLTTKNGTLWVCQQPSSCHFSCSEDEKHLYSGAVERFLRTNQQRPKCCGVKPDAWYFGRRKHSADRNYAKMKVITDTEKESFGRPFFTCSKENDRCSYFQWGDECLVKRPLCRHGKPCEFHTVKKEGPNYYRSFFCCPRPKNDDCKYFIRSDVYQRPGLWYFSPR